jgi:hypothetical protein
MKNFGSNKSQAHDNKRIQLQPFENFPAEPVIGELVYIKNSSISELLKLGKEGKLLSPKKPENTLTFNLEII